MISIAVLLAVAPVPSPPAPPLPTAGEVHCTLKSDAGENGTIVGKLGLSEPRYQGKRYPILEVTGTGPFPSGEYGASWTTDGGRFTFEQRETLGFFDFRLIGHTYKSGKGAMAVQIWDSYTEPKYFTGFCDLTFISKTGVRAQ